MATETIERTEKELLTALSDYCKAEKKLKDLARKYRIALFGSDYKNPKSTGHICSFCAKNEEEIEQFVSGANSFICNECIELCYGIIHER